MGTKSAPRHGDSASSSTAASSASSSVGTPDSLNESASLSSMTYEATKAHRSTSKQPDKIHWDDIFAFRDQPYRQLHHQRGVVGTFGIRLLEAANLQRSYWSALALGPVKHLGLSKAHGAVSAFCTFSLLEEPALGSHNNPTNNSTTKVLSKDDWDKKPAAKPKSKTTSSIFTSPVVPSDNNPVWENCQFQTPFRKGLCKDGNRLILQIRVDEEATAVENFLPGVPSGGDSRLLGVGQLDLTELCLGETMNGQTLPGVRDSWVPISLQGHEPPEEDLEDLVMYDKDDPLAPPVKEKPPKPPAVTGMVRVLVSYRPHGLEPQKHDVVALESFARRNPSTCSIRPIIPPLMPLTVLDRRGPYLLLEYLLADGRKACVRLHRNAVFVIERQNFVDAAHNLALLPIDVVAATPVGQTVMHAFGPLAAAGRELLMPALLSLKLVWVAARTTTLAGLSGVQALGSTMWQEGSSSLTASHHQDLNNLYHRTNSDDSSRHRRDSRVATAQFVSL